ncbi:DUF2000 family protein [Paenibacillus jiagnxiensis]|uniref:DUF2000 family protein n=1 Tax=Paenibacillus jiagnxiensis TaxID=3228926 RepID=UPI0033BA1F15
MAGKSEAAVPVCQITFYGVTLVQIMRKESGLVMKRVTIILDKNLEMGAAANAAALLMGQAALMDPTIYAEAPVFDKSGIRHAGIKYSTVILKAGENQLLNLLQTLPADNSGLSHAVFSKNGQLLNNAFEQYAEEISAKQTEETKVVGVILWGEEELVRSTTKKYSVLK